MASERDPGRRAALRLRVHGRVQGVFFRHSTRRVALSRGVAGWVANRPDGTVEALLEGDRDGVEAVLAFCRRGPRGAAVERVEVEAAEPGGFSGFEVR